MTYREEEVIYMLTTEDVNNVARELHMRRPSRDQYGFIRRYVERSFAYCDNNWHDVIADALAEMSRLGKTAGR